MKLLSLTLILFLASCTSFTDTMDQLSGTGQLSESYQQFNDSTTYEVSPTWLYRGDHHKGAGSIKLGARWNTKIKEYVALVASYDSTVHGGGYLSISSIEVSIDEQVSEFTSAGLTKYDSSNYNTVSGTIYTSSTSAIAIPIDYFNLMMSAEDVRIRINTSDGFEDSVFSVSRTESGLKTAKAAFIPLQDKIQSH